MSMVYLSCLFRTSLSINGRSHRKQHPFRKALFALFPQITHQLGRVYGNLLHFTHAGDCLENAADIGQPLILWRPMPSRWATEPTWLYHDLHNFIFMVTIGWSRLKQAKNNCDSMARLNVQ
jgi:hypothetical protein